MPDDTNLLTLARAAVREWGHFSVTSVMRRFKITYTHTLALRRMMRQDGELDDDNSYVGAEK